MRHTTQATVGGALQLTTTTSHTESEGDRQAEARGEEESQMDRQKETNILMRKHQRE